MITDRQPTSRQSQTQWQQQLVAIARGTEKAAVGKQNLQSGLGLPANSLFQAISLPENTLQVLFPGTITEKFPRILVHFPAFVANLADIGQNLQKSGLQKIIR